MVWGTLTENQDKNSILKSLPFSVGQIYDIIVERIRFLVEFFAIESTEAQIRQAIGAKQHFSTWFFGRYQNRTVQCWSQRSASAFFQTSC